jgi:hypothetical protein
MTVWIFLVIKFCEKLFLCCTSPLHLKENTRQLSLQTKFFKTKNLQTLIPYSPILLILLFHLFPYSPILFSLFPYSPFSHPSKRKQYFYQIVNNSSISLHTVIFRKLNVATSKA